jgi:hypothetical protein
MLNTEIISPKEKQEKTGKIYETEIKRCRRTGKSFPHDKANA